MSDRNNKKNSGNVRIRIKEDMKSQKKESFFKKIFGGIGNIVDDLVEISGEQEEDIEVKGTVKGKREVETINDGGVNREADLPNDESADNRSESKPLIKGNDAKKRKAEIEDCQVKKKRKKEEERKKVALLAAQDMGDDSQGQDNGDSLEYAEDKDYKGNFNVNSNRAPNLGNDSKTKQSAVNVEEFQKKGADGEQLVARKVETQVDKLRDLNGDGILSVDEQIATSAIDKSYQSFSKTISHLKDSPNVELNKTLGGITDIAQKKELGGRGRGRSRD